MIEYSIAVECVFIMEDNNDFIRVITMCLMFSTSHLSSVATEVDECQQHLIIE